MKTTFIRIVIPAAGLFLSGMTAFGIAQQSGGSAFLLLILLIASALIWTLLTNFERQKKLPKQLFRALANGDGSMGLPKSHPLLTDYEQARQQILVARENAGEQALFLRQVLLHTNLALLICKGDKIVEQSPAAIRLLGLKAASVQQLCALQPTLADWLTKETVAGKTTIPWVHEARQDTLVVSMSEANISGETMRIISLQSIHGPLNQREQQAYSRLTRVLTHEVANSITPLSSLAVTCSSLLPNTLTFACEEDKQDLQLGLNTIVSRTTHLNQFIQEFRKIAAIPQPQLTPIGLAELMANIRPVLQSLCDDANVTLRVQIQDIRQIALDPSQIEQVIINLVKNAIEAIHLTSVSTDGQVTLHSEYQCDGQLLLDISDNGPGVTKEARDMIFVPFYTTKREGSGIGLALAKQIMVNHGGDLTLITSTQGACFRLIFS